MPRPSRDEIHRHFEPLADEGTHKHPRARCRYCNWNTKRDATRQERHLRGCNDYLAHLTSRDPTFDNVAAALAHPDGNATGSPHKNDSSQMDVTMQGHYGDAHSQLTSTPMTSGPPNMASFTDPRLQDLNVGPRLAGAEKRRLDVLYARAIVAEGQGFNLFDQKNHPHMHTFLKSLNPAYEPPDRKTIQSLLMDEFFSKAQNFN